MNQLKLYFNRHLYIFLICATFVAVYTFSLTFVYIVGDDASIIAYHLLGRDNLLRPRYAVYQAMFDVLLSLLPANETLLRVFSISLSAISACIFTFLSVNVAFHWKLKDHRKKLIYTLFFLCLSPELFFSGLYLNPSIVAFVLVFLAHTIVIKKNPDESLKDYLVLISAALFGLGTSLRWNSAIYGITIFLDLVLPQENSANSKEIKINKKSLNIAFMWAILALSFSIVMVGLSLYKDIVSFGFSAIISTISTYLQDENIRYFSPITMAWIMSLLSPLLILITIFGIYSLIGERHWKMILILTAQLPFILFFIKVGRVKETMVILPIIWALFIEGAEKLKGILRSRFWVLLFFTLANIPWFIGIKIYSNSTLWGPGFEIREPERTNPIQSDRVIAYSPEISFGFESFEPVLNAGFSLPSSEGPRPLGGYMYVLFGGLWRQLTLEIDQNLKDIIQAGVNTRKIIKLGAGSDARIVNNLHQIGFTDYSPLEHLPHNGDKLPSRSIMDLSGNTVMIYYAFDWQTLLKNDLCIHQPDICDHPVPFMTNYTSDLNSLFQRLSGDQIIIISPISGYLNIVSSITD